MLTAMSDEDWDVVMVFRAVRSRRGAKGRDDRKFLEALHFFTVHNTTGARCRPNSESGTRSGSGSGG